MDDTPAECWGGVPLSYWLCSCAVAVKQMAVSEIKAVNNRAAFIRRVTFNMITLLLAVSSLLNELLMDI
jgi:hypothetical protein